MDSESRLIVATQLCNSPVDVRQLIPVIERLQALPEPLGTADILLADAGYFSAANVAHCEQQGITPLIARRRDQHYQPWYERHAEPGELAPDADAVTRMAHRLKTPEGRALYGLRKQLPEPVFGIIKQAMGFRQFLLRGLQKAQGEWTLVALAYNIRRLAVLTAPA